MDGISLCPMTRELCHAFFQGFENDPALLLDPSQCTPYEYSVEKVDRYFDAQQRPDRLNFAVMRRGEPIGEVKLKAIDREKGECEMGICMKNDTVKGKGYGCRAEELAVSYALHVLGMTVVNADTLVGNVRSQHVLEKLGFRFLREEGDFRYYRYEM
mgnify:CR=1 FL=1